MPMTKDQILEAVMELSPEDRSELAVDLLQTIDLEPSNPDWRQELRRRADAIDRGEMKLIPADEALRKLRARASR
jgi:putative addiction module component (TIGR02574 family)